MTGVPVLQKAFYDKRQCAFRKTKLNLNLAKCNIDFYIFMYISLYISVLYCTKMHGT